MLLNGNIKGANVKTDAHNRKVNLIGSSASVGGPQNCFCLRVLKDIFTQQVILLCAGFSQSGIPKAEVAVRIQANRDAQGVWRQLALEAILTNDVKQGLDAWRKKEAAVAKLVEGPIRT